jgi:prepilin-type processing-associated H-X9-DG protein
MEGMGCYGGDYANQACARSKHPGGLYTAFCDGSVHWISDYIDIRGNAEANSHSVWDRLMVSGDSAPLGSDQYE